MRWFWNMWETLSSQKEFKCEVDLCQHIANRVGEVFSFGKKSGKQQLQNPLCCRWRRKRDVLSCKLVRYCNTNLVLIWTRNLEAPELKAETSTYRPRFWDLGACLVWGTHWNYQLWKVDSETGNVFSSLGEGTAWIFFSSKSDANNVPTPFRQLDNRRNTDPAAVGAGAPMWSLGKVLKNPEDELGFA